MISCPPSSHRLASVTFRFIPIRFIALACQRARQRNICLHSCSGRLEQALRDKPGCTNNFTLVSCSIIVSLTSSFAWLLLASPHHGTASSIDHQTSANAIVIPLSIAISLSNVAFSLLCRLSKWPTNTFTGLLTRFSFSALQ